MKVWATKMRTTLFKAADESVDNTMTEKLGLFKQETKCYDSRAVRKAR